MRKLLKVIWNAFPEIFLNQNNLRDFGNGFFNKHKSLQTNACLEIAIKTLGKGTKYVQSLQ